MEIILLIVSGFVLLMVLLFSIINITVNRVTTPTKDLQEKVAQLEEKVEELENRQE